MGNAWVQGGEAQSFRPTLKSFVPNLHPSSTDQAEVTPND